MTARYVHLNLHVQHASVNSTDVTDQVFEIQMEQDVTGYLPAYPAITGQCGSYSVALHADNVHEVV